MHATSVLCACACNIKIIYRVVTIFRKWQTLFRDETSDHEKLFISIGSEKEDENAQTLKHSSHIEGAVELRAQLSEQRV